jgi:hypothetical protein
MDNRGQGQPVEQLGELRHDHVVVFVLDFANKSIHAIHISEAKVKAYMRGSPQRKGMNVIEEGNQSNREKGRAGRKRLSVLGFMVAAQHRE